VCDRSRGLDGHFDVEDLEHVSHADKLLETRSATEALARVKRFFPRRIEGPAAVHIRSISITVIYERVPKWDVSANSWLKYLAFG
jgi:hypothetical protein